MTKNFLMPTSEVIVDDDVAAALLSSVALADADFEALTYGLLTFFRSLVVFVELRSRCHFALVTLIISSMMFLR